MKNLGFILKSSFLIAVRFLGFLIIGAFVLGLNAASADIVGTTVTQYDYNNNTLGMQFYQAPVGSGVEYQDTALNEDWDPINNTYTINLTSSTTFSTTGWLSRFSGGNLDRFTGVTRVSGPSNLSATVNGKDLIISVADLTIEHPIGATWVFSFTSVNVSAGSSDATLSSLVLSQGTLSPTFASGTTSYTASVPNSVSSLTVTR